VANIWDNRKGLNYFFELASLTDHKIIIIGKMDSKNKKIISSMQSITHIEQTANQQELAKYYREALIFVNPTLQDNYPTTNLEAISCGTPVVTFDTGGSAEEINTNTGVVCKTKKTSEIILGIEKVKDNYKKNVYANLGENLNLYSKESMIEKYILLMKGINENEKNIVL
ncbi:glycosyltransferase, partial [Enterococcus casseliflavus]